MPKEMRVITDPNLIAIGKLVALLEDGTRTCAELAEETGLTKLTVYRYCAAMHRAGGAHITAWEQDPRGAFTVRVFALGRGKDAVSKPRDRAKTARVSRQRTRTAEISRAIVNGGAA